ncbi:hypothetical protein [Aneurinibacillus aneurinilyticus]|uniref:hypothetical protein n=1 Tax=Aneurinibacillus aneurinilyticus TaxID=1391 RepID=UPI0036715D28
MPDLTPNMGLEKPLDNETADIQVINNNMDKIDTAFADSAGKSQEIIDLIGKNNAPAGTTTLFARLTQLANYVDTLESLLGLNTDPAGTSSIFARLAQISAYVDTLEAQLGTSADGSTATGNLHQKVADLKYHLGNITDGPNPTGSVNSKLVDIKNAITASTDWSKQKPRILVQRGSVNPNSSIDIINITGKGYLLGFYYYVSLYYVCPGIIIDGVQTLSEGGGYTSGTLGTIFNGPLRFNNSLRIYLNQPYTGQGLNYYVTVTYSLD